MFFGDMTIGIYIVAQYTQYIEIKSLEILIDWLELKINKI